MFSGDPSALSAYRASTSEGRGASSVGFIIKIRCRKCKCKVYPNEAKRINGTSRFNPTKWECRDAVKCQENIANGRVDPD